jgi:hypothetical protein
MAGSERKNGIEVQLANFGNVFDHPREAKENFFYGSNVGWGMAAISLKQPVPSNLPNHFLSISISEGRHPKAHVAENLDMDPAEAECDERTE